MSVEAGAYQTVVQGRNQEVAALGNKLAILRLTYGGRIPRREATWRMHPHVRYVNINNEDTMSQEEFSLTGEMPVAGWIDKFDIKPDYRKVYDQSRMAARIFFNHWDAPEGDTPRTIKYIHNVNSSWASDRLVIEENGQEYDIAMGALGAALDLRERHITLPRPDSREHAQELLMTLDLIAVNGDGLEITDLKVIHVKRNLTHLGWDASAGVWDRKYNCRELDMQAIKPKHAKEVLQFFYHWAHPSIKEGGKINDRREIKYFLRNGETWKSDGIQITDGQGEKHSLPMAAFCAALGVEERQIYLPRPQTQETARELLDTLNLIMVDGDYARFTSFEIIRR